MTWMLRSYIIGTGTVEVHGLEPAEAINNFLDELLARGPQVRDVKLFNEDDEPGHTTAQNWDRELGQ